MRHNIFFGVIIILFLTLIGLLIPYWLAPPVSARKYIIPEPVVGSPLLMEGSILEPNPLVNIEKPMHTSTPLVTIGPLQYILSDYTGYPIIPTDIVGIHGVFTTWDYVPNREFYDLMKSLEKKYSSLEGVLEAITDSDPIKGLNPGSNIPLPPIGLPPVVLNPSNPVQQSPR